MRESRFVVSSFLGKGIGLHILIIGDIHVVHDKAHSKSIVLGRNSRPQLDVLGGFQGNILDCLAGELLEHIGEGEGLELGDGIFVEGDSRTGFVLDFIGGYHHLF